MEEREGKVIVEYPRMRCPFAGCDAWDPLVESTQWPYRWHRCRKCGRTFQSFDKGPRGSKYDQGEAVVVG